jgi:hypothetical protein
VEAILHENIIYLEEICITTSMPHGANSGYNRARSVFNLPQLIDLVCPLRKWSLPRSSHHELCMQTEM